MKTFISFLSEIPFALFLVFFIKINVFSQVSCPADIPVCANVAPFTLSGAGSGTGVYSGSGVSGAVFTASSAGIGDHTITYTENGNVCTFKITVNQVPDVSCILGISAWCGTGLKKLNGGCWAQNIQGETITGSWSGPGVAGNPVAGYTYDPAVTGVGFHNFVYTATTSKGCSASGLLIDGVDNNYSVSCPQNLKVNPTTPPFELSGGIVELGSIMSTSAEWERYAEYSGPGVDRDTRIFDPAIAGDGTHTIVFSYRSNCLTVASCTYTISTSLPVSLERLETFSQESAIKAVWKTVSEVNFDHFELERSENPKAVFKKIADIKGSNNGNNYEYLDQTAPTGLPIYYRLKMVDRDGTYAYSKIAWALIEGSESLSVFPNPVHKEINIKSPGGILELSLINTSGITVLSQVEKGIKSKKLTVNTLPAGSYLLQVKGQNGISQFKRVILE